MGEREKNDEGRCWVFAFGRCLKNQNNEGMINLLILIWIKEAYHIKGEKAREMYGEGEGEERRTSRTFRTRLTKPQKDSPQRPQRRKIKDAERA